LSPPRPGRFTLREKVPITQRTGGWVGPTADLDVLNTRKRRNSNLGAVLIKLFRLSYAYNSSFVFKTLTSSTAHMEETPGRIHQTYSNFLPKKRKCLWHCYMYGLYTATFYTLDGKVNTTFFFIASEPVRKPCIYNIIINFSRILVTAL